MSNIGLMIKKRRNELGLTQEELAIRLGYKSKSTINKIESGINDITQSKIIQFAKALDTTPSYLMGWHQDYIVSLTPNTSTYIEMQQCNNQDRNQRLFHYASLLDKLNDEQLDIVYTIICQMLPQSPTEDSFHMNQTPK